MTWVMFSIGEAFSIGLGRMIHGGSTASADTRLQPSSARLASRLHAFATNFHE